MFHGDFSILYPFCCSWTCWNCAFTHVCWQVGVKKHRPDWTPRWFTATCRTSDVYLRSVQAPLICRNKNPTAIKVKMWQWTTDINRYQQISTDINRYQQISDINRSEQIKLWSSIFLPTSTDLCLVLSEALQRWCLWSPPVDRVGPEHPGPGGQRNRFWAGYGTYVTYVTYLHILHMNLPGDTCSTSNLIRPWTNWESLTLQEQRQQLKHDKPTKFKRPPLIQLLKTKLQSKGESKSTKMTSKMSKMHAACLTQRWTIDRESGVAEWICPATGAIISLRHEETFCQRHGELLYVAVFGKQVAGTQ